MPDEGRLMKEVDPDLLPELYSRQEMDKARRRHRIVGRIEGIAAAVVAGTIFSFLGWIPTVLVLGAAGYLIYRFVLKPRKSSRSSGDDPT
ncbi:MAG: hypothetical protein OXI39_10700 [Gemmatimonadota bacterium]|uniref:hypothetical protein n=1 Tax=Candidatus Palauibacter scopulicola TaxID=3056741 RepID=UPI0023A02D01|nr:hypothetical protein [Candidatus Palauibacter scopulicola]MDE2663456.1 hypothetical protein [Candidatus Palauibacter scopulicola]